MPPAIFLGDKNYAIGSYRRALSKWGSGLKNLNTGVKELNYRYIRYLNDSLLSLANFLRLTLMISWCGRGIVRVGNCPSGNCPFGEMSGRGIVRSGKCPFGKMSVGEMSVGELSFGEMSVGEMSGYRRGSKELEGGRGSPLILIGYYGVML